MKDAWDQVKNYCLTLWCENTVVSAQGHGRLDFQQATSSTTTEHSPSACWVPSLGVVLGTWQVTSCSSGILTRGAAGRGFPTRAEQAQEPTESFGALPSAATPKV